MKAVKKSIALFLAFVLTCTLFSACTRENKIVVDDVTVASDNVQSIDVNRDSTFRLPYTKSDSLNPFFAVTLSNQTLATLLYQPLFQLDAAFEAQGVLAQSCKAEKNTLVVTLGKGHKFTDNTPITAKDVVYSFNKAKKSAFYQTALSVFTSAKETEGETITFNTSSINIYASQLLTFAVVKNGTAETAADLPIGSGRFVPEANSNNERFVPNPTLGETPVITSMELVNVHSQESIENALRIGNISLIFNDLSQGIATAGNAKSTGVPLNNVLYLGFNPSTELGSNNALRQAVSFAINRKEVGSNAYHSFATAATSMFNPLWKGSEGASIATATPDSRGAQIAMEKAQYNGTSLTLLVNSENSFRRATADLLAKQLNTKGFHIKVNAVDYATYTNYLATGQYDLFLGEVKLTDDMKLDCFFTQEGSCAFSINVKESQSAKQYQNFVQGKGELGDFVIAFKEEMPFVPVAYRQGVVSYTNRMKVKPTSIYGDIFANVEQWTF